MVQDVPKQSYRGVLCMACRQPIPLPAILITPGALSQGSEASQPPEHTERVFSLRCRACSREKPYRSSDIMEFEGTPRPRVSHVPYTPSVRRQLGSLSRAANG